MGNFLAIVIHYLKNEWHPKQICFVLRDKARENSISRNFKVSINTFRFRIFTLDPLVALVMEKETLENSFWSLWLLWSWKRETTRKFALVTLVALVIENRDTQKINFGHFGCLGHRK